MPSSDSLHAAWLGVIADDVTGATDLAGYVARSGVSTLQFFGVPGRDVELPEGVECVIIALKSRSIAPDLAVEQSLAAQEWLAARGVRRTYFKYCSTFDSTPRGNIGPVADVLADRVGETSVIVAPSAPENGRTVYQGKLFVWSQTLDESPLKDHPLNPMRDADLPRLLGAQSAETIGLIPWQVVSRGAGAVKDALAGEAATGNRLVVVDALTDDDLDTNAHAALERRLVTGSAGLAAAMARVWRGRHGGAHRPIVPAGSAVVISGSCSAATQRQVESYRETHPSFVVDPVAIANGAPVVEDAVRFAQAAPEGSAPLIYSTADPSEVTRSQEALGVERAASLVEGALGEIARRLRESGTRRFVIAGGETSGAIVDALHVDAILIGDEVAPGVPWTVSTADDPVALVLKSGNFGDVGFFEDALDRMSAPQDRSTPAG